MGICALPTADKQLVVRRVGTDLVKQHGKRRYYTVAEVKAAARRQSIPHAWDCWALSLFTSPNDFVDHHVAMGESCDYAAMHAKMVEAVRADSASRDQSVHADPGSTLPDVAHHPSAATGTSWFSDLLDALGTLEGPDWFDP